MFQIQLKGITEQDVPLLLAINKSYGIYFGDEFVPAKARHSSHHKSKMLHAYDKWAAEIWQWNLRGRGTDDPANRRFFVRIG